MIIAIDGPSGAGKTTVSKLIAERLGYACLDTGAMYRSVALKAIRWGIGLDETDKLASISEKCIIEFESEPGSTHAKSVCIDGVDVTGQIRTGEIDQAASKVSAVPAVRTALVAQQRNIGASGDYVVEGRDIGTVVFPDAPVKVFLTASDEERARRRVEQNKERGVGSTDFEQVLAEIIERDERDASRDVSPLRAADDAFVLDSSPYTIDEVVDMICKLAESGKQA